jgi:4-hydroxyphenylacetate 3-monooxygenase
MRTGSDYLAGLNDQRAVYVDGQLVTDVTKHAAFAAPIRAIAATYDTVATDDSLSCLDPVSGERSSGIWRIPRTSEDLVARRTVHQAYARQSYGLMGRTPDHVASLLTAFAAAKHVFARGGDRFAENVQRFYDRARREDLYVTYTIVPPQIDRSKPAHQQPEPFLYAGVAAERADGIVIRGAQNIGTSLPLADWLLVTCIVPLRPGDEDYAFSCVMPMNSPGLRIYPRRPYAQIATSEFDYPLSSRFDESDSVVVFDDVLVPWENVFVNRDIALTNAQFHQTGAHLLANYQSLCRFTVKLQFACGLAIRLAELHGIDALPPVQGQLGGGVATIATQIEALVIAAEQQPVIRDDVALPNPAYVYTGMSMQRHLVIDLAKWLRELAGGAFIAVPSSDRSFGAEETAADLQRYYRSATASATERVKLLKLMWDFVGTEFAGRQLQYEMFYSAAQHVADARVFQAYDWDTGRGLVDDCLATYQLEVD